MRNWEHQTGNYGPDDGAGSVGDKETGGDGNHVGTLVLMVGSMGNGDRIKREAEVATRTVIRWNLSEAVAAGWLAASFRSRSHLAAVHEPHYLLFAPPSQCPQADGPQILHWEDRATEWSGIPDEIEVLVSVFDTETGSLVDKARIKGTSSWWTLGGDEPQDLLDKPVGDYVARLVGP